MRVEAWPGVARNQVGVMARRSRDRAVLPLVLLAASLFGCATPRSPSAFEGGSPEMRPEIFFAGTTSSSGVLETTSGAPTRRLHATGSGQTLPDGDLRLVQHITFDQDAPTARTWLLRRVDTHRYTATLTDATGPVTGEAYGDLFHLRYRMQSPVGGEMEQWLYLQPDGRTVLNEATVSVLGITVAHLSERITHED
jgi:hypothetical protein